MTEIFLVFINKSGRIIRISFFYTKLAFKCTDCIT